MKINTLLKKTALAAAIATVSFGATAGTLTIAQPTVLANEIFGNESEATSIRLPQAVFVATGELVPATFTTADTTIKLTLGQQAIFAENYQDPAQWASQGIVVTVGAGNVALIPADIADITGGTANDNQITITLKSGAATAFATENVSNIVVEGFKVKRLKAALERQGAGSLRTSDVTLEVRQDALMENTPAAIAFASINGLALDSTATTYVGAAGGRARIQVDALQQKFTFQEGSAASNDFDGTVAKNVLTLGTVNIKRGKTVTNAAGVPVNLEANKEAGSVFDFTGGDEVELTLTSDVPYANYGKVYLSALACAAPVPAMVADFSVTDATQTSKVVKVPTANINLDGTTAWNLCATVDGTKRIPQAEFDLGLSATYYSTRYTNSVGTAAYGKVLRNGCQVTLFNLPNVNAQDDAFIRLTNTSLKAGELNAYVWTEDGQQLDVGAKLVDKLDPHATVVLHTNAAQTTGVYLGNVLPEFAQTSGRSRIVLEGAFQSCEALGLVRSPNGPLVNMTSTTQSGGPSNTSNTSN